MSKLREWRTAERLSMTEFGAILGVSSEAVRRWELGVRIPEQDKMVLIFTATNGAVEPNDFYELPPLQEIDP